jgi:hypothetical protein
VPKWLKDRSSKETDFLTQHVALDAASSALYSELCSPVAGECTYPSGVVTLSANLPCDDIECSVDTVRIVEVDGIYYGKSTDESSLCCSQRSAVLLTFALLCCKEFLRQPCVQQLFYEGGKKVAAEWSSKLTMCAYAKMAVATEACCGVDDDGVDDETSVRQCLYAGERMSIQANDDRCKLLNRTSCDPF